jgi:hypothetical protein
LHTETQPPLKTVQISIHKEAVMIVLAFANPLYVKDKNQIVHEITCVEDALEFLYEWPAARRGKIHETAVNACQAALVGELTGAGAGKSFKGFARSARILTDLSALVPMLNGPAKPQGSIPT